MDSLLTIGESADVSDLVNLRKETLKTTFFFVVYQFLFVIKTSRLSKSTDFTVKWDDDFSH